MSERLVNVDREAPMLLPVDMRQWVSGDELVYIVIQAVDTMKLPALTVNQRGSGSSMSVIAVIVSPAPIPKAAFAAQRSSPASIATVGDHLRGNGQTVKPLPPLERDSRGDGISTPTRSRFMRVQKGTPVRMITPSIATAHPPAWIRNRMLSDERYSSHSIHFTDLIYSNSNSRGPLLK